MDKDKKLGATGEFPDGKLTAGDEGEIRIAVHIFKGNVVMQFGKDVSWFAMPPLLAKEIGNTLLKLAYELDPSTAPGPRPKGRGGKDDYGVKT